MAIDLKNLSPKELRVLIANANAQMHDAQATQVQAVKQKIEALLSSNCLTLNDVYPLRVKKVSGKKGATGTVAPKYRNPSDPSKTWSGRGRQPGWFAKALRRHGVTADSLLIDGAAAPAAKPASQAKKGASAKKAGKRAKKNVATTAKA